MSETASTFDEVMLDWGIAEVLSPNAWEDFYSELGVRFRERVAKSRGGNLSAPDRALLLEVVQHVRRPLIVDECGIDDSWKFWWSAIKSSDLSSYSIIRSYGARYGDIPFGQFAVMIRDHPADPDKRTQGSVLAMLELSGRGVQFTGRPIAVMRPHEATPLLIEGYKRSMVAMLGGTPALEVYFCRAGCVVRGNSSR